MKQLSLFCEKPGCTTKPHKGATFCSKHRNYSKPKLSKLELFKKWFKSHKLDANNCLVPNLTGDSRGYKIRKCPILGKQDYVHRISYRVFKGEIPAGMYILHKCDNPSCMNPNHLIPGTPQDNMDDKMAKGRHVVSPNRQHIPEQLVLNIKLDLMDGESGYALAKKYKITQMAVSLIRRGKTYTDKANPEGWTPQPKRKPGRPPKTSAAVVTEAA